MSRERADLGEGLPLALAAAVTTWLTMWSWRGFIDQPSVYLAPLLLLALVVAGVGVVGRARRLPAVVTVLAQIVVGVMVMTAQLVDTFLPVGGGLTRLLDAFGSAMDAATEYAAPVPHTDTVSVQPLLLLGGLVAVLLVDLIACTWRRVPIAGLPLLTVASVPVSMLDSGFSPVVFVFAGAGFLLMLFLQESQEISLWGRSLSDRRPGARARAAEPTEFVRADPRDRDFAQRTGRLRTNAVMIGGVATVLAVLVPLVVPTMSIKLLDFGRGAGDDTDISIKNPMVDLRRDLLRGPDVPVLQVTTDKVDPEYLRISVLNRFGDNEWTPGDRDVPSDQTADGQVPLEGISPSLERRSVGYSVNIFDNFDSRWLPTQAPVSTIEADGDWRYDIESMDFLASDDDLTAAGESYSMTGIELDYSADYLSRTSDSTNAVSDELLDLPDDLAPMIGDLARDVTGQADSRFEKAVALQNWLRSDGGFEYSTERAPRGNGADTLEAFLTPGTGRVGYCEQFAASMAVMAREIGIPSRVAVGFLAPEKVGESSGGRSVYEYSAHDLHAWTELYFQGAGWVLFDATPQARTGEAPSYTRDPVDVGDPRDPRSSAPSEQPSRAAPQRPTRSAEPEQQKTDASSQADSGGFPWLWLVIPLVLLVGLVLSTLLPRGMRRRHRERRLRGGPEDAWDELRATVVDLGRAWPGARSPRETRERLVDWLGAAEPPAAGPPAAGPDASEAHEALAEPVQRPSHGAEVAPEAVAALDRIVVEVERSRYARTHQSERGLLHDDAATCVAALEAGATPRVRRLARWWPRSVVSRRARVQMRDETPAEEGVRQDAEQL